MKKFFNYVVFFLIGVVLLTGCAENEVVSSLTTYATEDTIWQYYYDESMLEDEKIDLTLQQAKNLKDNQNVINLELQKFISVLSNRNNFKSVIRDCVAVIDTFDAREKLTLFDFDDLIDYQIRETVSGSTYKVSYNELFERNVIANSNKAVDDLINNVPLVTELTISLEKGESNIYNIKSIVKDVLFPTEISAFSNTTTDDDGNSVELKLVVNQNEVTTGKAYVQTTLTASEIIKSPSGRVVSSYERESKYLLQNNHFYLRDIIKIDNSIVSQQNIRLDNTFSNISISYNKETGYMSYNFSYNLQGNMTVFGETYFQGLGKYYTKEYVNITQGTPFNLAHSYVLESEINLETAKIKVLYDNSVYVNIRDQNLGFFATHTADDGNSVVAQINNQNVVNISFYS